ncbi:hypothetical protein E7681_02805 [Thalassobius vesicularis]|uniref:Tail fiber domain-containing protein n=1 Tax=Thalassobius vesicularis TaxID=1294297 RepID=A0A4S3MER3_9RHOB|nr:hypothetical protein [Thalassobius vesicularis]THD76786.1 hypothetical protein E7681_02805 [Thalassobius vesicularis]
MKHSKLFASTALTMVAGLIGTTAMATNVLSTADGTINNSLCVGTDCTASESFGFDTMRLKENNLRFHFDDTSASASFPNFDWRIIANDSANGGDNYLAIEDSTSGTRPFRVDGTAPNDSLRVDAQGEIGLGTSSPVVELHIVDGNTPTVRLEQNGSSGFTAQTWDVAGNETNFFIRDATNGSLLPFKIRPSAPTNSLYVNTNGDIGLGTASPDSKLHVNGGNILIENAAPSNITLDHTGDAAAAFRIQVNNSARFSFVGTGAIEMELTQSGDLTTAGSVTATSFIANGTTLNVPDYVFSDSYNLMPLSEVAAFIEANSHLPKIPSAKDINSGTLDMTQMQMALLEKIEELTLYTLDQQAQIAKLEARLDKATSLQ